MAGYADDGGDTTLWVQFLTPTVLLVGGVVLLVLLLVLPFVVWRVWRRVRRSGAIERGLLEVRAQALPAGVARELAELRLRLRASVNGLARAVAQADEGGRPIADMVLLLGRLQRVAESMDTDLGAVERSRDPDWQRAELTAIGREVQLVIAAAGRAREALARTAAGEREVQLRQVAAEVDDQVAALDSYRQAYRELGDGRG